MKKAHAALRSIVASLRFSFVISWGASRRYFLIRTLLEIVSALQPIAVVFISKEAVNLLVAATRAGDGEAASVWDLAALAAWTLALNVGTSVATRINDTCVGIHRDLIAKRIHVDLATKTAALSLSAFDSPRLGNELNNVMRDSRALETLTWFAISMIRMGVQAASAAAVLGHLHPALPLLIVLLCVPSAIIHTRFTKYVYAWNLEKAPEQRKMEYLQSVLRGRGFAKELRLYDLSGWLLARYDALWTRWFGERRRIAHSKTWQASLAGSVPHLGAAAVFFYAGHLIMSGQLTLGDFTLNNQMAYHLIGCLVGLVHAVSQVYDNDMKIANHLAFLKWDEVTPPSGDRLPSAAPTIELRDVSFRYPGTDKDILCGLNLILRPGERVALAGVNGAGKSTIVKLLLRFYEPTRGELLVDGVNAREYDLAEYRRRFGVVFQDFARYAFTVRENIALPELDARHDEPRLRAAATMSGADVLLAKWPKGPDAFLMREFEWNGGEPSGGEWQRIAVARAFFSAARYIVLDEPSSALDPQAEADLFRRFELLAQGRGALIITHRLANMTMVDRIAVLEHGAIVEEGSHAQLMARGGRYAQLFRLQAERYRAVEDPGLVARSG